MMNFKNPQIEYYGSQAVSITWKPQINTELLYFMKACKAKFEKKEYVVEAYFGYHSLILKCLPNNLPFLSTVAKDVKSINPSVEQEVKLFELPVCYEDDFAPDLEWVAQTKGISTQQLIKLHAEPLYTIYFIGFIPGFLYLGGLDRRLHIPRKNTPRLKVPKGAVGLAEEQTGIYPHRSEGGWQIIGNCPISIFQVDKNTPTPFTPGDKLRFKSISATEYKELAKQVSTKNYRLNSISFKP